jgi:hypothetical protein
VVGEDTSRIGIGRELPGRRFGSFPPAVRVHALNYHIATAGSGYQATLAQGWPKASTELGAKHQVRQLPGGRGSSHDDVELELPKAKRAGLQGVGHLATTS